MKKVSFLLTAVLLAVFLTACSEPAVQETIGSNVKGDVVVAVVYPVDSIDSSTRFWQGIQLALDQVNASGGVDGKNLRVIKLDDQGSVTEGINIAQSLVEKQEVTAVIGHWNSRVSIPVAAIYEHAGMPMISPASTSPELMQGDYGYIFQQVTDDSEIGRQMAVLVAELGYTRIAAHYADDAYGRGLINSFEDSAQNHGVTLVDRLTTLGSNLNVQRIANTWQALEAEAVFIADVLPEAGETVNRLKQAGLSVPVLGATGLDRLDFISSLGEMAEGTIVATLFNPYEERSEVQEFVQLFTEAYQVPPDVWAAQGYDTIKILSAVINQVGSLDSSKIANGLRQLDNWPGVTGVLSFDSEGRIVGNTVSLKQVQDGQFVYLSEGEGVVLADSTREVEADE